MGCWIKNVFVLDVSPILFLKFSPFEKINNLKQKWTKRKKKLNSSYFPLSGVWSAESEWIRKSTRTMKVVVKVASRNTRTEQLKPPTPPTQPASSFFHAKEKTLSFWAWHNMCVCVSAIVYNKKEEVATGLANPNQEEEEELFLLFHLFPHQTFRYFVCPSKKK